MAVRTAQTVYGPYQATFNAIDIGGMESFEVEIENREATSELINGQTLRRVVGRQVSVTAVLVETGGVKTALAALFPDDYTTASTKGQILMNAGGCGAGADAADLILTTDCDTGTAEDLTFFGARPSITGIETPADAPRRVTVRFDIEGNSSGDLLRLGSTA